ncbi:MAG: PQQ-dependent sugar dehydrogenase [Gemmatimonadota bacterium]
MARSAVFVVTVSVALGLLAACDDEGGGDLVTVPSGDPPDVALEEVATGLDGPVHLTAPPGDDRVFIVEQPGRIRILRDGSVLSTPYLDITDRVASGGERGLLSVAFHPRFAENGRLYVNYTDQAGDTRVVRFEADPDADTVDPGTAELVLVVEQPFANHNGGLNLFGPDGMLYIGLGDGGSAGDPEGNGQDTSTLLGSILRLDVDGAAPYAIPSDNPFVDGADGRAEIWAYGLRNPWRFSFDEEAGRLYVADVGQNRIEEINVQAADAGGLNYGWNVMEGTECFRSLPCDTDEFVLPALEYSHDDGCSVTGGVVYRGEAVSALVGHYVYGDYCDGWIRSFRYENGEVEDSAEWDVDAIEQLTSFGTDAEGELYVLSAGGTVSRVVVGDG